MHCINELGSSLYNIACVWIKSFTLPWKKFSKHFKVNINPIWLFFYARRIVEHKKEKFFHNYEKSSKVYIEIHVLTNLFTYLISHNVSSKHNFRSCIFLYLILSPLYRSIPAGHGCTCTRNDFILISLIIASIYYCTRKYTNTPSWSLSEPTAFHRQHNNNEGRVPKGFL